MPKTLIKNARIVNESSIFESDILVEDQFIKKINNYLETESKIIKSQKTDWNNENNLLYSYMSKFKKNY